MDGERSVHLSIAPSGFTLHTVEKRGLTGTLRIRLPGRLTARSEEVRLTIKLREDKRCEETNRMTDVRDLQSAGMQ